VIGRLSGKLIARHPPQVVIDVQGVGYELDVPMSTFYQLPPAGAEVTLLTHLIVREDAHQLFGFASDAERRAFRQLLRITGVGARIALAVLSGLSVSELKQAVASQDGGRLVKIPGIGKKTAERLILELRDKLPKVTAAARADGRAASGEVVSALLTLGYNEREAQAAAKGLSADLQLADAIRQALKALAKT
jgi:Holliday junction DNA helicase RuvA